MKKLYTFLIVALIGFVGNAQFSYPGTYFCTSATSSVMPIFSPGTNTGGTFTSNPVGLLINPVTGEILPSASIAGPYIVTYTIPPGPPDFVTMVSTRTVIITSPTIPVFAAIPTICQGGGVPALSTTSSNGIIGTWSPSTISNTTSATYTFTPNAGQCAVPTVMNVAVFSPHVPVITTASGLNTVYVDGNNQVVVPLELLSDIPNDYDIIWAEDSSFVGGIDSNSYTVNTASPTGSDRLFTVFATHIGTSCDTYSSPFVVHQSSGTPPPFADRNQNLPSGSTLENIVVSGNDVRWYAAASDKNNNTVNSVPLPLNTVLVDNATYYASQTVNGSESVERYPVTVHLVLGVDENELTSVSYFPNPVNDFLTIKALDKIDSISVVNMLGQVLKTTNYSQAEVIENLNGFAKGTYFIRVNSGNRLRTFRIIKE